MRNDQRTKEWMCVGRLGGGVCFFDHYFGGRALLTADDDDYDDIRRWEK